MIQVSKKTYEYVYSRDKGRCQLCGRTDHLDLHHINGRSRLKTNDVNNCIMLCHDCHMNKAHRYGKKYRTILQEIVEKNAIED